MELRHLRYFEAVAQTLHFGQAADRLNISQPAVSKQIKELEDELGFPLFIRYKKKVVLTDVGKVFWAETCKTLQQVERSVAKARLVRQGEIGEMRIGYDSAMLQAILTPLLKEFKQHYPGVKLILQEGCNLTLSTALVEDRLDVAFTYGSVSLPDLTSQPLGQTGYVVVLPLHHRLAGEDIISLAQLREENFILCPRYENPALLDEQLRLFEQAGYRPNILQESSSQAARINMVSAGLGITLTVDMLSNGPFSDVVFKPLREKSPDLVVSMAWHRGRNKPVVNKLVRLTQTYKKINAH
ncbi:LysR family transcriptional regulator [Spirosoma sp. HMF4905]|uniref:LysR family transcriptional regulator n=1 Tax=Spirosoma arboris TaxID=2682092 RepID=A0A7K1SIB5_9BACT|nr:LysR substrate-binding domain-containing protein [Spirosoma arboris]MVM33513.1 LysR family transcriptional regulator [Spirosoma arboris]